jgi:dimethylglycine dehydrogenase
MTLWALAVSYGGELGWELHGPRDASAGKVYDALWAAGEAHGIADYGSFAMNALRMEKGFKGAGELTNEVTLPRSRRDALRQRPARVTFLAAPRRLPRLTNPCRGSALIWRSNRKAIGTVMAAKRSGSTAKSSAPRRPWPIGHTVGKVLAFAYVKPARC